MLGKGLEFRLFCFWVAHLFRPQQRALGLEFGV